MTTFSGRKVNITSFTIADVDIHDIARGLSNICRFAGHVREFLSVASHSLMVEKIVASNLNYPTDHIDIRLAALLHDASEAYLADLISPFKKLIHIQTPEGLIPIRELEQKISRTIMQRYWLENYHELPLVKEADKAACGWEMENCCINRAAPQDFPKTGIHWENIPNPRRAERRFLRKFSKLFHYWVQQQQGSRNTPRTA